MGRREGGRRNVDGWNEGGQKGVPLGSVREAKESVMIEASFCFCFLFFIYFFLQATRGE